MPNLLVDTDIHGVHLVGKGANGRKWALLKHLTDESTDTEENSVDRDALLKAIGELDDEQKAELVKSLGVEIPEVPEKDDIVATVLKALGIKKDEAPPLIQDEQTREAIAKMSEENDELRTKVDRLEKSLQEREEADRKAKARERVQKLAALGLTEDDVEGILDIPDELFEKFVAASQQAATSELFKELGRNTDDEPADPEAKLEKIAKGIREKNPDLTKEQAFDRAMKQHPELYLEYTNVQ